MGRFMNTRKDLKALLVSVPVSLAGLRARRYHPNCIAKVPAIWSAQPNQIKFYEYLQQGIKPFAKFPRRGGH